MSSNGNTNGNTNGNNNEHDTNEHNTNGNNTTTNGNNTTTNGNNTTTNGNNTTTNGNSNGNSNGNNMNTNENSDNDSDDEFIITNEINNSGNNIVVHTTFNTTDLSNNVVITEDFKQTIEIYDNNNPVLDEIKSYAALIKCENFHGKGSIDDYSELFIAASKIANETKQMNLDIDIDGFNDFGKAADDLSALFNSFIVRLQNVNIINDSNFLNSVLDALKKIVNLSNVFGQFKETILATTTIKIPKSAEETRIVLENVMSEVNCAMNYIGNFVTPNNNLHNAQLDEDDKEIISNAVKTIDDWAILCNHGVSIALNNNEDINKLKTINDDLKSKTNLIKNATTQLLNKFSQYNINN